MFYKVGVDTELVNTEPLLLERKYRDEKHSSIWSLLKKKLKVLLLFSFYI